MAEVTLPAPHAATPARIAVTQRRWWSEVIIAVGVYAVYSAVRAMTVAGPDEAFTNATTVVGVQDVLGVNVELAWQRWALQSPDLVVGAIGVMLGKRLFKMHPGVLLGVCAGACTATPALAAVQEAARSAVPSIGYGVAYAVVTPATLIWLYRRHPDRYGLWRNTLAFGTLLALVGFALFPLMPPRLLDVHDLVGGWGFVDTLATHSAPWSFQSSAVTAVANPYAAMPSLHCGWALWVGAAIWSTTRSRPAKVFAVAYPLATLVTVVITGNHFVIDAVGALAVMGTGWVAALTVQRRRHPDGRGDVQLAATRSMARR